jgi:hypothetical protein
MRTVMNESLVLARLRHASRADPCSQFGVDRTQRLDAPWALHDPSATCFEPTREVR